MSVDSSLACAGYAIADDSKPGWIIVTNAVKTPSHQAEGVRLAHLYKEFKKVFKKYKPHHVVFEAHYLGPNPDTFMRLCWAQGVIIMAAREAGAEVSFLTPTEVKQAVTGSGNANKEKVAQYILALYTQCPAVIKFKAWVLENPTMKTDDMTDAMAILHTWRMVQRGEYHRERKAKRGRKSKKAKTI